MSGLPEDFKAWRNKSKDQTDEIWNAYSDAEKEPYRDEYLTEVAAKRKESIKAKGGFWSSIFGTLFGELFAGFDKKSLN